MNEDKFKLNYTKLYEILKNRRRSQRSLISIRISVIGQRQPIVSSGE